MWISVFLIRGFPSATEGSAPERRAQPSRGACGALPGARLWGCHAGHGEPAARRGAAPGVDVVLVAAGVGAERWCAGGSVLRRWDEAGDGRLWWLLYRGDF